MTKTNATQRITAEVLLNPWAASLTLAAANEPAKWYSNLWWAPPHPEYPTYGLSWAKWRAFIGGLTYSLRAGKLDGSGSETLRAVAIFADPAMARLVSNYERRGNLRRSVLYLTRIDDKWYASLKYREGVGAYDARPAKGGPFKRKRRRRWAVTPPDWPRDKRGRALSDRAIAQLRKERLAADTSGR